MKNGKHGKGGTDENEMAALEAITNVVLQEVKASQDPNSPGNGHIGSGDGENKSEVEDDNEPKLLRIIIYETSV